MSAGRTLTGPPVAKPRAHCATGLETLLLIQVSAVCESHSSAFGAFHGASTGTSAAITSSEATATTSSATSPSADIAALLSANSDSLRWVTFPSTISVALPVE
jgi:hypothetical protein